VTSKSHFPMATGSLLIYQTSISKIPVQIVGVSLKLLLVIKYKGKTEFKRGIKERDKDLIRITEKSFFNLKMHKVEPPPPASSL
jgi:hypothetical protein